LLLLLLKIKI